MPTIVVGPSIDEVTLTFVRAIIEPTTELYPSQTFALNAFPAAFQQWNPQTMSDVKVTDKATLDLLFAPAPVPPRYDQAFVAMLQTHRNMIGELVQKFNDSLSSGQLTLLELRAVCAAMDSQVWDTYKLFNNQQEQLQPSTTTTTPSSSTAPPDSGITLGAVPTPSSTAPENSGSAISGASTTGSTSLGQIQPNPSGGGFRFVGASTPFQVATSFGQTQIVRRRVVSRRPTGNLPTVSRNSPQLQVVPLLPTNCSIVMEIHKLQQLRQTIDKYNHACIDEISYSLADCAQNLKVGDIENFSTSTLQRLLENLQQRIGNDPDFLYYFMYFTLHPSILLERPFLPNYVSTNFNLPAKFKRVRDAFGSDMSYEGVGTVLELLSNKDDYNAEMKVLLNCEIFKISALDVTIFRAVKLLHEISRPLRDSLHCCDVHHFGLVESDSSFRTLQTMVEDFYSTRSHNRASCLEFMSQVYGKLCSADIDDGSTVMVNLLRQIKHIKLSVDALSQLRCTLHGVELRNYFRTMQWLTVDDTNGSNEGLTKFDKDYKTVLDILRSNDAAEELLIIESLQPVVRIFSLIEQDYQQIHELVSRMKNEGGLRETAPLPTHVLGLQSRIHSIQDLFHNVVPPPPTSPSPRFALGTSTGRGRRDR